MKEKLTYKIAGKEYLLIEVLMTQPSTVRKVDKLIEKLGAIEQGIKDHKQAGMFSSGLLILKILVPVNKIKQWQDAFRDK